MEDLSKLVDRVVNSHIAKMIVNIEEYTRLLSIARLSITTIYDPPLTTDIDPPG